MKIYKDFEQGSVEWMLARSGIPTASELDNLVTPLGKVKTGQGPKTYLYKKLAEAWIGGPLPAVMGIFDMEQGKILEEYAKPAYTLETGQEIQQVAFCTTDDGKVGCSPDGLIGETSGIEIKCPHIETHIGYLLKGVLPEDYVIQVHGSMYVTKRREWQFMSFRRNFPSLILTIEWDDEMQEAISQALTDYQTAFDDAMLKLIELNGGPPDPRTRGKVKFKLPDGYKMGDDVIP